MDAEWKAPAAAKVPAGTMLRGSNFGYIFALGAGSR
jgi:hypothetical protein